MYFLTLFPHATIPVMPVFNALQVMYQFVDNSDVGVGLQYNTFMVVFQFTYPEKYRPDAVVLFVPPFFPKLLKGFWMKTGMNILVRMLRLFSDGPVNLILMFFEDIKYCMIGLLDNVPFVQHLKGYTFIKIIP